jgi:hypothetical protein
MKNMWDGANGVTVACLWIGGVGGMIVTALALLKAVTQ